MFNKSLSDKDKKRCKYNKTPAHLHTALFMKKDIWMQSKQFAGFVSGNFAIFARTTHEI